MIPKCILIEKMMSAISHNQMIDCGQKILVAVSGGPDSIVLLHALSSISSNLNISLHAAHLNHCFRGSESDGDAEYVASFCESIGIDYSVEKIDVPGLRKDMRLSEEQTARIIRYDFLNRMAEKTGSQKIALAHTADDQVETSLINYIRGTGIDGLAGIPATRGIIIRPLINLRRTEIYDYIRSNNIYPRIDSTNLLPIYTRNKVRLELLPFIRSNFSSDIDESILRLAELSKEDSAYLNYIAENELNNIVKMYQEDFINLDCEKLSEHHISLQRRILRLAIKKVKGSIKDIGYLHINDLIDLMNKNKNFIINLPDNIMAERVYANLVIRSNRQIDDEITFSYKLGVPDDLIINETGTRIVSAVSDKAPESIISKTNDRICGDFDKIDFPIIVRNWMPGDNIKPLGMMGTKKLQDVFSDKKIPKNSRMKIPIVSDSKKIIWIAGIIMSDCIKITENTNKYIELSIKQ